MKPAHHRYLPWAGHRRQTIGLGPAFPVENRKNHDPQHNGGETYQTLENLLRLNRAISLGSLPLDGGELE